MPLETATYTADLVTSNPAASDAVSTTDDHLRMIKGALKATFPNFSSAPLNSTQANIDATVQIVGNGVSLLASNHALNTASSGLNFTTVQRMDLVVNGVTPMQLNDDLSVIHNGPVTVNGAVNSTGVLNGPGAVPIGGMVMWLSDTLPTLGQWCWANGGVLSRTGNGAALYGLIGTTYGSGNNVDTFNVINMCEVVPSGKSGMGGASSPGLLQSISSATKGVLGGLFGADTTTLQTTNLPPYTPAGSISGYLADNRANLTLIQTPTGGPVYIGGSSQGGGTAVPASFTATFSGSPQGGASTPFGNLGPRRTVNFIIRIG